MGANRLCHGCDSMVLDVLRVACNERYVLALFVLQAYFPACKEVRSWLHVLKPWILEWSLELAAHDVFKAIVGDDVMVGSLILDGNSLLHQASFLELVAVDKGPTETSLLVGRKALCEVGIDFTCRVGLARKRSLK